MKEIIFESVYYDNWENYKILDLVDFKAEEVEPIVDELSQAFQDSVKLNVNTVILQYKDIHSEIIDDEFIGKRIVSCEVKLNETYDYCQFLETDNLYDLIEKDRDCFSNLSATEEADRVLGCIEEKEDCNYINNYSFNLDIIVKLRN